MPKPYKNSPASFINTNTETLNEIPRAKTVCGRAASALRQN